jgi:hypothetical protein
LRLARARSTFTRELATAYLLSPLDVAWAPASWLAQQLAVATLAALSRQQASPLAQQANWVAQQSPLAAESFVPAAPQQALPSSQQALPSPQHGCGLAQQAWFLSQQPMPFLQQPSLSGAAQQALPSLQQESFASQQFFADLGAESAAQTVATMTAVTASNPPASAPWNFVNME